MSKYYHLVYERYDNWSEGYEEPKTGHLCVAFATSQAKAKEYVKDWDRGSYKIKKYTKEYLSKSTLLAMLEEIETWEKYCGVDANTLEVKENIIKRLEITDG